MRCRRPLVPRARPIILILMDVDGVLTDGGISFIEGSAEAKTYDARDGVGLSIARRIGLRTGVISGRSSAAVSRRAEELGMHEGPLRVRDKLTAYERVLRRQKLTEAQVGYIGDDPPGLPGLGGVGIPVALADGRPEAVWRARLMLRRRG